MAGEQGRVGEALGSRADAELIDRAGWLAAAAERFGRFDAYTRDYAESVAALRDAWLAADAAVREAQRRRREGRGRRPSLAQIARLQRRAGLAWQSYDGALRRLEELASGNGRPPDDLAALLSQGAGP